MKKICLILITLCQINLSVGIITSGHEYYVISAGDLVKSNVLKNDIQIQSSSINERKRSAWKVWRKCNKHDKPSIPDDNGNKTKIVNSRNASEIEDDYDTLRLEYFQQIYQRKNETLNVTEVKDEPLKEVIKQLKIAETPQNCSAEDGYGVQAVECLVKVYEKEENVSKEVKWKLGAHILILGIIMITAIKLFLWCTKGWCCCCCPCQFCKPNRIIQRAKRFITVNPPGIWDDSESGYNLLYTPAADEICTNGRTVFLHNHNLEFINLVFNRQVQQGNKFISQVFEKLEKNRVNGNHQILTETSELYLGTKLVNNANSFLL